MRLVLFLCCASMALAQGGTEPKPKAEDYDVHTEYRDLSIGAEFMIHSFSGQGQTYITQDFLVVEVALYPPKGKGVNIDEGAFALRINGKKQLVAAAPPAMVVSSLQHPDWRTGGGPRMEADGGVGNTGVILGRPTPSTFPGQRVPPNPLPRMPQPDNGGIEPERRVTAEELVVQAALQQGHHNGATSGYLYFPYKGKTTSIKSLDLLYEDAELKLR